MAVRARPPQTMPRSVLTAAVRTLWGSAQSEAWRGTSWWFQFGGQHAQLGGPVPRLAGKRG